MTQLWSSRLSSRIRALRNRPALMLLIDASTFSIWLLYSSSARPYVSAARPYSFRLAYVCGTASMASWTAKSVGSRFARMFQGTSARSNWLAEVSAQPARSRAWFEKGPSRRTRSSACFDRSKLPGLVQLLDRFRLFTGLQQGDTEVVGDKPGQVWIVLQVIQHFDGFAR